MDRAFLEDLGLKVRDADGVIEAELELNSGQAMNPLTRQFLNRAQFTVVGDRLIAIDPPELVGLPPINVAHLQRASALEDIIVKALNDAIMHVQRRSAAGGLHQLRRVQEGHVDRRVLPHPEHVQQAERLLALGDHAEVMALVLEDLHLAHPGMCLAPLVGQSLLTEAEQPVPA